MPTDFLFQGGIADLDPALTELVQREAQRQRDTVILIPSESIAPPAVLDALVTPFANIYAEGYPREESRRQTEAEILDYDMEMALYRRQGDPRYYKGVEYADLLEALARRRAAELFAANGVGADNLYVNVQPLSGGPANSAIYTALLQPGETIMGLNLNDGGHLSHGSKVNRSGQVYNSVPYFVDKDTELLDYDAIEAQVLAVKPKIIVAGYSAYPAIVDWQRFRAIADKVGAYLSADISHISGLVVAGVHPSPVGVADVVMTTTHKSLCGPRGAMIITHRADLAKKLDRAVFPGEQGGPHLNTIAALAVALRLAGTEQFRQLQQRIARNARRLSEQLEARGLRLVGGVSENHLLMIDAKSIDRDGAYLSGDMAARILDIAGIVTNRNTIPSDTSAFSATGVRLGTVWISQLGYGDAEIDKLAEAIATALHGCVPFTYSGPGGKTLRRAKIEYAALQRARELVRELTQGDAAATGSGSFIAEALQTAADLVHDLKDVVSGEAALDTVEVRGEDAVAFLNLALASNVAALADGESQASRWYAPTGDVAATVHRQTVSHFFVRFADADTAEMAATYFRDLSDGFVQFGDVYAKLPGPVAVKRVMAMKQMPAPNPHADAVAGSKPYFVGCEALAGDAALPPFTWREPEDAPLRTTSLHQTHRDMGARMVPFGGWDMPVWYTSVSEEHAAVRQTAGLFDVSHMGVLEASGPYAAEFLNMVTTNDINTLSVGQSHYTYLLFPDGSVVDDLLVYRRGPQKYMLVVNASNNDKDWAWLTAVNEGRVMLDPKRPWVKVQRPCVLRDLRDPRWGDECRVDIALQGPRSMDILLALVDDRELAARVKKLPWAGLMEGRVGGFDIVISRTGYTGERVAYELFVHPDMAPAFWQALLAAGELFGIKPCGLAARDSTRTEAGLPLYGHELAGPLGLNPGDAGFASYVKLWKPFFIGREAFIAHEQARERVVARFRMNDKAVRRPELGDPVLDRRGKVVGTVTSCAIDVDGYLLGQAVLPLALTQADTPLSIYQLGGGERGLQIPKSMKLGARLPRPDDVTVLTRFPSRKK
ncbi:MAG: glycine cleavage system aminomethyltransferase GcvT [Anaerolineales bacterium]|nr:glycine cleavage system aminomethyltransferase GcvT [Anaerolineales bacterium]MCB8953528.1 glycine cleavage system aminomethyltransferase GcvT [Ardenticatenales bacterium]